MTPLGSKGSYPSALKLKFTIKRILRNPYKTQHIYLHFNERNKIPMTKTKVKLCYYYSQADGTKSMTFQQNIKIKTKPINLLQIFNNDVFPTILHVSTQTLLLHTNITVGNSLLLKFLMNSNVHEILL